MEVKSLGSVFVKGLPERIEVYEFLGARPVRSRLNVAAVKDVTRFVGRESELDELRRAKERAEAGQGQIVGIMGEPGVGKSRLCGLWSASVTARSSRRVSQGATAGVGSSGVFLAARGHDPGISRGPAPGPSLATQKNPTLE